jgi:hypothetical protein
MGQRMIFRNGMEHSSSTRRIDLTLRKNVGAEESLTVRVAATIRDADEETFLGWGWVVSTKYHVSSSFRMFPHTHFFVDPAPLKSPTTAGMM